MRSEKKMGWALFGICFISGIIAAIGVAIKLTIIGLIVAGVNLIIGHVTGDLLLEYTMIFEVWKWATVVLGSLIAVIMTLTGYISKIAMR